MKNVYIFFILCFFAVFLLFYSGCTLLDKTTPQYAPESRSKYSLDEAYRAVSGTTKGSTEGPLHLYYIKGINVVADATAEKWIFGVKRGNSSYFITYDQTGTTEIPWQGDIASKEILIDNRFFSPKDLFAAHPLLIKDMTNGGSGDIDELELVEGEYYLSQISDASTRVWIFNGTTGTEVARM
jgi:hypothetical protein